MTGFLPAVMSAARAEPEWLREARLASLERYLATPWPTGAEEEWRRTSLKDLPRDATLDEGATTEVSDLDPDSAARGVVFAPLAEAAAEHPDLVRPLLTDDAAGPATHGAFWHLARTAWTTGTRRHAVPASPKIGRHRRRARAAREGAARLLSHARAPNADARRLGAIDEQDEGCEKQAGDEFGRTAGDVARRAAQELRALDRVA